MGLNFLYRLADSLPLATGRVSVLTTRVKDTRKWWRPHIGLKKCCGARMAYHTSAKFHIRAPHPRAPQHNSGNSPPEGPATQFPTRAPSPSVPSEHPGGFRPRNGILKNNLLLVYGTRATRAPQQSPPPKLSSLCT